MSILARLPDMLHHGNQALEHSENVPPNSQDVPHGRRAQAAAQGTPSKARRCVLRD